VSSSRSWGTTDHDGVATEAFEVGPCAGASKWIVFPGGYLVTTPRCVHLSVVAGDHREQVRVGIGTACPGQRPPAPIP
jgi:hypothetical protein